MDRPSLMPPFAYYGGKTTLAAEIAGLLPPHEHYVEPFAGSLAVLLAKPPSPAETVNDLDLDLVTFWRVLRDRPDDLERVAFLTPHSRAEFAAAWNDTDDELEHARRVWVRLTQNRAHSLRRSGWKMRRQVTAGSIGDRLALYAGRISPVAERLCGVTIENRDALDLVRDYGREPTACLYVDPPYLGSTRAANYGVEMLGDEAHIALADALNDCRAAVVLSGYDSPLYAELFAGWHQVRLAAPRALSGEGDRVEVLWSNRPIGEPDLFAALEEAGA